MIISNFRNLIVLDPSLVDRSGHHFAAACALKSQATELGLKSVIWCHQAASYDACDDELKQGSKVYFTTEEELLIEESHTRQHKLYFTVYFEDCYTHHSYTLEKTSQGCGDIANLYVRTDIQHSNNVETILDRHVWRVMVSRRDATAQHHAKARMDMGMLRS